jgi:cobalamin synthase
MNRELYMPVIRAIVALVLVILVKFAAMLTLRDTRTVYAVVDIALSLAVVIVLLRFRLEFNRQLATSKPDFPEARSFITGLVLLLVILTLYWAFVPYSGAFPDGSYSILFFILALVPVYLLWSILNKNAGRLSEVLLLSTKEEKRTCSCGGENPGTARFCNKCGSPLQ